MSLVLFLWWESGAEACYPGKIRVLVTLRYRRVDLKLTNIVLKRNIFYYLKQQGSANKNGANAPGSTRDYCNLFHYQILLGTT